MEERLGAGTHLVLDIRHGLVEGGQRHLPRCRLSVGVGHDDAHMSRFAGLILLLARRDGDVQQLVRRRNEQFALLGEDPSVANERRLGEEVRLTAFVYRDVDDRGAIRQVDEAVAPQQAVDYIVAEDHVCVGFRGVDHQVSGFARLVGAFVGDDLDLVEAMNAAVEFRAHDPHQGVALHLLAPGVLGHERDAILPGADRRETELEPAVGVGRGVPPFDLVLVDLSISRTAVFDPGHDDLAGRRHRRIVGRDRADLDIQVVAMPIPAAIGLDKRIEGLPRHNYRASAADGPAAYVAHVCFDRVAMIVVGVFGFGLRRVKLDFVLSVGAERDFALRDQLAQGLARAAGVGFAPGPSSEVVAPPAPSGPSTPPRSAEARETAPFSPPSEPWIRIPAAAVARPVEPVVLGGPPIGVVIRLAEDLVRCGSAGDGRPEVISRLDRRLQLFAHPGLGCRRLDDYLELGLPVFLDAERASRGVGPVVSSPADSDAV